MESTIMEPLGVRTSLVLRYRAFLYARMTVLLSNLRQLNAQRLTWKGMLADLFYRGRFHAQYDECVAALNALINDGHSTMDRYEAITVISTPLKTVVV